MEPLRKPFQGVLNIIRFNSHFFAFALAFCTALSICSSFVNAPYRFIIYMVLLLAITGTLLPLVVSFYIYDLSGLYNLNWLNDICASKDVTIINIHAGFDETSALLQKRYLQAILKVYDFYDPVKHTEASIRRARKAYPPFANTLPVSTALLPIANNEADYILLLFAAHEIRDNRERIAFFKALNKGLKPDGTIIVLEHLRDIRNFMAYNIGFLHFLTKRSWHQTFSGADLQVIGEENVTPFIRKFVLGKNGNAS